MKPINKVRWISGRLMTAPPEVMYPHERPLVKRLEVQPFALLRINSDRDRGCFEEGHGEGKILPSDLFGRVAALVARFLRSGTFTVVQQFTCWTTPVLCVIKRTRRTHGRSG